MTEVRNIPVENETEMIEITEGESMVAGGEEVASCEIQNQVPHIVVPDIVVPDGHIDVPEGQIVVPDGQIVVPDGQRMDGGFVVEKFFDANTCILDNDSFQWVPSGKKMGNKLYQKYICKENCGAFKMAKKTTRVGFGGKYKYIWRVKYYMEHSCEKK